MSDTYDDWLRWQEYRDAAEARLIVLEVDDDVARRRARETLGVSVACPGATAHHQQFGESFEAWNERVHGVKA